MPSSFRALLALACGITLAGCIHTQGAPTRSSAPEYLLPFPEGDTARLIQGNNGPWGHTGAAVFAYDFRMPIGSPVTASRAGTVVATEGRFLDGNRMPGQENFVVVRHADGSYSRYYHLTEGGALIHVGAEVTAGDTIARSGNTGASAGPHLHFDVTVECYQRGCRTVPFHFANAGSDSLIQGRTYKANKR